jgi:hypothetical protein
MKLAYILDVAGVKSFYVKNGEAYTFKDDKPYTFHHSVSPSLFMAGWNYPFLWPGGCYINLNEFINNGLDLPDVKFDMILYANERCGLDPDTYDDYTVARVQESYPDATIFGWFKEIEIPYREGRQKERLENRIKFFKDCGENILLGAVGSMKDLPEIDEIEKTIGTKIKHFISCPIPIDGLYDTFYSDEKEKSIYAYLPNPPHRRGKTYEFCNYLSKKYNIPVRYKPLQSGQRFDYLSQKDFIDLWSSSLFHVNMDPIKTHPGQQCIQVAAVGSVNLGGLNESHHILFPDTATNDENILEEKFKQYLDDENELFRAIQYAWEKLNEKYSFNVVKQQLSEVMNYV